MKWIKIVVNLVFVDICKEGFVYDLFIVMGVLVAFG